MLRVLLSLMLATGVGVGAAYAQEKEKSNKSKATAEEKFQKLNKAGDGKLTLKEYLAGKKKNKKAAEEAFGAADKDKKGYLTLDEFKTIYPRHHKHRKHGGDRVPEKSPELPAEKAADKTPESK